MDDLEPDGRVSDERVWKEQHHLGLAVRGLGPDWVPGDQDRCKFHIRSADIVLRKTHY